MKKLKDIEQLMMQKSRQENPEYDIAFNNMAIVLQFLDEEHQNCHCKIINALYNVNRRILTYERIACDMYISDNALRRYRKYYARLFDYFLKLRKENITLSV